MPATAVGAETNQKNTSAVRKIDIVVVVDEVVWGRQSAASSPDTVVNTEPDISEGDLRRSTGTGG